MADLPETSTWEPGVYQIENTDPVVGGPPDLGLGQGISNVPPQQLANRTKYLFDQIAALQSSAVDQADIDAAIATLIGGAPLALDTLNELAAALADDENYAATITTALAGKLDIGEKAADYVKAWVNFDGTGVVAIKASDNVSSITDNGTGDYTLNFAVPFADANYAISMAAAQSNGVAGHIYNDPPTTKTSSAIRFRIVTGGNVVKDSSDVSVIVCR